MKQIALETSLPEDVCEQFERQLKREGMKKSEWLKEMMLRKMGYWGGIESSVLPNYATEPMRLRSDL